MYQLLVSGGVLGLFLQVVPITCLVGFIYAVYRCLRIKKQQISVVWRNEIMRRLFVCYLTGLINLTLVPNNLWSNIWARIYLGYSQNEITFFSGGFNFIPTIIKVLSGEFTFGSWMKTMLVGNLLMFIPMGFFLVFVHPKIHSKDILKVAAIIPVTVEIIQPIVGRSFDVDDLILNFIGIMIGYFAAAGIRTLISKKDKEVGLYHESPKTSVKSDLPQQ